MGIQRDPFDEFKKKNSKKEKSNYGAMIAAQGTPLKKSVELTHWNSEEEKQAFIREYIQYAKEHGLTKQYEEAIANYPEAGQSTTPAPSQETAMPPPPAPVFKTRKAPPAIANMPRIERPVQTVQFQRLGFLGMSGLITVRPNQPSIQKGPDPTAGYNFDTYLVNMETGEPVPAQYLGGTRYRVLMGTPECPGCHFGSGLEVDLEGEHPLFILGTMALQTAPMAARFGMGREMLLEEEATAAGLGSKGATKPIGPGTPGGGGRFDFTDAEFEQAFSSARADKPGVRVPVNKAGTPAQVLEVGAGPKPTELGLPPDAKLVEVTSSDINPTRPGVGKLDATKPVPPEMQGAYDAVIINNPRRYVPNIEDLGKALKPGGRIIIQGKGEVFPGMRGINPDFQKILEMPAPPGYRKIIDLPPSPTSGSPQQILGGPFFRTTGEPVGWPNGRVIFEKLSVSPSQ